MAKVAHCLQRLAHHKLRTYLDMTERHSKVDPFTNTWISLKKMTFFGAVNVRQSNIHDPLASFAFCKNATALAHIVHFKLFSTLIIA